MPRKPREFAAGGIYHVFNRGNNQKILFETQPDYECFRQLLQKGLDRERVTIFHYCLMNTHYHLLIRSEEKDSLPRFMHWVQLGYVRIYNKKHGTSGHVFEERYRSPRIAEESYYLQCGRYIERNPVKAGQVLNAEDYPYSSAAHYAEGRKDPLITDNLYYQTLGQEAQERRLNYKDFIRMDDPYAELISRQLLKF